MTQSLEHHGFLIFFISILIVTQLRWAESYDYDNIAQRLSAAVLVGAILNWGLKKWLDGLTEQIKTVKWQWGINDISFTLSFSFLWMAFHENGQLGGGIVLLFIIYLIKSNDKARTWMTNFLNSKKYDLKLDETQEPPVLIIKGNYDADNLVSFQYLCVELTEIFFEMINKNNKKVQINLQVSNISHEKMLPLIHAIADSYDIEYTKY